MCEAEATTAVWELFVVAAVVTAGVLVVTTGVALLLAVTGVLFFSVLLSGSVPLYDLDFRASNNVFTKNSVSENEKVKQYLTLSI